MTGCPPCPAAGNRGDAGEGEHRGENVDTVPEPCGRHENNRTRLLGSGNPDIVRVPELALDPP